MGYSLMQLRRGILLNTPHLAMASGEIATFQTDMAAKLKKLTVGIEPVQSGTGNPSPSNVRPITSLAGATVTRAGTNLLEVSSRYDTKTSNAPPRTYSDGILGISGTISAANVNFYRQSITGLVKRAETCVVSTHIISGTTANLVFRINEFDENGTVVARKNLPTAISYTSGHTYDFMGFISLNATVGDSISFSGGFQLELGPSASTYEPYRGVTIPVAFGKNLFDQANATIYTRWFNNSDKWANSSDSRSYAIPAMPGVQVTVSANNENITIFRVGYIKDEIPTSTSTSPQLYDVTRLTAPGSVTITPSSDATYIIVQVNAALIAESKIQVEYGATATPYEPANIIYGGTLDILTGVLTVTWVSTTINDELWSYSSSSGHFATSTNSSLQSKRKPGRTNLKSSAYLTTNAASSASAPDYSIRGNSNVAQIYVKDTRFTDVPSWKAVMGDTQIVYELAEPLIVQLTPEQISALKGTNNIWADTGEVETQYWTHI